MIRKTNRADTVIGPEYSIDAFDPFNKIPNSTANKASKGMKFAFGDEEEPKEDAGFFSNRTA